MITRLPTFPCWLMADMPACSICFCTSSLRSLSPVLTRNLKRFGTCRLRRWTVISERARATPQRPSYWSGGDSWRTRPRSSSLGGGIWGKIEARIVRYAWLKMWTDGNHSCHSQANNNIHSHYYFKFIFYLILLFCLQMEGRWDRESWGKYACFVIEGVLVKWMDWR